MDPIDELLTRGVDTVYPSTDALEKVLRTGKKLTLYQGFDPTGTKLHIGHMVGLRKLKQFQDLGHRVIFLIGDFTGMIGDPTGKKDARKPLTRNEVLDNAIEYRNQAKKILRFDGQNPVEIMFNFDWNSKLTFEDVLKIVGHFTAQQMIERDMFQTRIKEGKEINLVEFLYPLIQGYDSVAMDVDLEIGGTDQTFNMLAGRKLVREILGKEKYVLTLPLLTDSKGVKIGKTEGNIIAITSPPTELYGMIMSLPDDVIVKCFEYLTDVPSKSVRDIEQAIKSGDNPMKHKKHLAFTLTRLLNSEKEAIKAEGFFEKTFQKREVTGDIPTVTLSSNTPVRLLDFLLGHGLAESKNAAKRLISQGAVEIDRQKISDEQLTIMPKHGMVIKVGKHRLIKIIIK